MKNLCYVQTVLKYANSMEQVNIFKTSFVAELNNLL